MADLRELREQVRILLDEQEANLFSDAEIDREINKGAVHATRATQCLQFPFQKVTEADKAEYGCIAQTTDIIRVAYSDGSTTYDLKRMRAAEAGLGTKVTGDRPTHYYVRPYISQFMEQSSTNAISLTDINTRDKNDWRTIIGLYPAPSGAGDTITIDAFIAHPRMKKDTDRCLLPDGYEDCAIHFAVFKGLLKQKFYAEAKTHQDLYEGMVASLQDYQAQAPSVGHPEVRLTHDVNDSDPFQDVTSRIWVD